MLGCMAIPSVLTVICKFVDMHCSYSEALLMEDTAVAVGAYVEAKYTASRPPVNSVVVMGKCTVEGWAGWLMLKRRTKESTWKLIEQ
jgi:hypothetical protein